VLGRVLEAQRRQVKTPVPRIEQRTTIFSPRVVGKIETRNWTLSSSGPAMAVPSWGMPAW